MSYPLEVPHDGGDKDYWMRVAFRENSRANGQVHLEARIRELEAENARLLEAFSKYGHEDECLFMNGHEEYACDCSQGRLMRAALQSKEKGP